MSNNKKHEKHRSAKRKVSLKNPSLEGDAELLTSIGMNGKTLVTPSDDSDEWDEEDYSILGTFKKMQE